MKNLLTDQQFMSATPDERGMHWAAKKAAEAIRELESWLSPKLWSRPDRMAAADLTADDELPLRAHVAAMAEELEQEGAIPTSWEVSRDVGAPSPRAELGRRLGKSSRIWRR